MFGKYVRILVSLVLAAVLVFALGAFVYNIFNQEEYAIQVVPLNQQ